MLNYYGMSQIFPSMSVQNTNPKIKFKSQWLDDMLRIIKCNMLSNNNPVHYYISLVNKEN